MVCVRGYWQASQWQNGQPYHVTNAVPTVNYPNKAINLSAIKRNRFAESKATNTNDFPWEPLLYRLFQEVATRPRECVMIIETSRKSRPVSLNRESVIMLQKYFIVLHTNIILVEKTFPNCRYVQYHSLTVILEHQSFINIYQYYQLIIKAYIYIYIYIYI